MRLYLYFRIAGAIIFGWFGWALSAPLWTAWNLDAPLWNSEVNGYRLIPTAFGVVVGAVIFPYITIDPFVASRRVLRRAPASDLLAGLVGLIAAGVITVIVNGPLSQLPGYFGRLLPIAVFVLLAWIFVELSIAVSTWESLAKVVARHVPMPAVDAVDQPGQPRGQPERGSRRQALDDAHADADQQIDSVIGEKETRLGHSIVLRPLSFVLCH